MVRRVRRLKRNMPHLSHKQIADVVRLENGGRVSEILNGKRGVPMYSFTGDKL